MAGRFPGAAMLRRSGATFGAVESIALSEQERDAGVSDSQDAGRSGACAAPRLTGRRVRTPASLLPPLVVQVLIPQHRLFRQWPACARGRGRRPRTARRLDRRAPKPAPSGWLHNLLSHASERRVGRGTNFDRSAALQNDKGLLATRSSRTRSTCVRIAVQTATVSVAVSGLPEPVNRRMRHGARRVVAMYPAIVSATTSPGSMVPAVATVDVRAEGTAPSARCTGPAVPAAPRPPSTPGVFGSRRHLRSADQQRRSAKMGVCGAQPGRLPDVIAGSHAVPGIDCRS